MPSNKTQSFGSIRIQEQDFSIETEYALLRKGKLSNIGAICTFTGLVREFGDRKDVTGMFLEHYPGMTEHCLQKILDQAAERWKLNDMTVIHRVGQLTLSEQIVFVGVSSAHRADAFAACEFVMDYLKTEAPFWKKETYTNDSQWVEAKQSDQQRIQKWSNNKT